MQFFPGREENKQWSIPLWKRAHPKPLSRFQLSISSSQAEERTGMASTSQRSSTLSTISLYALFLDMFLSSILALPLKHRNDLVVVRDIWEQEASPFCLLAHLVNGIWITRERYATCISIFLPLS